MKIHEDGSITGLPVVRPATANPRSFEDTLLKAEHLSAGEAELLHTLILREIERVDKELAEEEG